MKGNKLTTELAKELALVTAVILNEGLLHGSVCQTFDNAYKIAEDFVKVYPLDTKWGIDYDLEYDEVISNFTEAYINNQND